MSETKRQLLMRRDMSKPLHELPELPEQYSIKAGDADCAKEWEWIIKGAFPEWAPKFDLILNDERCAPERVFYVREYGQPCATAAVQLEENRALIHMVGTHPYATGMNLAAYAVNAGLSCIAGSGRAVAELTTDDHRLGAVKTYLELGFEPVAEDEEMKTRWSAVLAKVNEPKGSRKPKIIELWPDGNIPYMQEGNCVPTIEAYPVEGSRGAVVVCPGGGYCVKASHEGRQIARMLNCAGISAYVLDYRVRLCHYEAPLADALRAIRVVRSMGYEQVAIMGFSAGGHLAASAATLWDAGDPTSDDPIERLSSRPDAFAPCYGATSFRLFEKTWAREVLGEERGRDNAAIVRYTAELNVRPDTPPAFIWHTADDETVPVECALRLMGALSAKGVNYEAHIYPHGRHGLGLATDDPAVGQWGRQMRRWLIDRGFGAK